MLFTFALHSISSISRMHCIMLQYDYLCNVLMDGALPVFGGILRK